MAKGICKECKKDYSNNSHAKTNFCSRSCMFINKDFRIKQSVAKLGKSTWNKGKPNTWTKPGFHLSDETKKKISVAKMGIPSPLKGSIGLRGELNPNWKGGKYTESYRERRRFRAIMQKDIFERDNYTCQLCGNGGDLQVDHIQKWSEYVELRFNIDNCRTLCAKCHYYITFNKEMPTSLKGWGHNLMLGGGLK